MKMAEATKEAVRLTRMVKELGFQQGEDQLKCDRQSAIYLAKNQVYHLRTKPIDIRFHTFENATNILTNPNVADKLWASSSVIDEVSQ